jgi:hypothetical protein
LCKQPNSQQNEIDKNYGNPKIRASGKTALAMLPWCRCYLDENYDYPKMMAREENSRECKTALVMLPWCGCYL